MKHTDEPWRVEYMLSGTKIFGPNPGNLILTMSKINPPEQVVPDAQRIVECVNALAGVDNPIKMRQTWDAVKELELDAYHKLKDERNNFIELVREMRSHQKEYFKNRTRSSLEKSKELERAIDLLLLPTDKSIKQPKLFE